MRLTTRTVVRVAQVLVTLVLGIFANQIAALFSLPTVVVVTVFIVLLALSVAIELIHPDRVSVGPMQRSTGPNQEATQLPSRITNSVIPEVAFPAGALIGAMLAAIAFVLLPDSGPRPMFGTGARLFEMAASALSMCIVVGYRLRVGTNGLTRFAVGLGFGVATSVQALVTSSDFYTTYFGHVLILLGTALTLKATRKRWWYSLSFPVAYVVFLFSMTLLPRGMSWLFGPHDGLIRETATVELGAPGHHAVYYARQFARAPHLVTSLGSNSDSTRLRIVAQDKNHFEVEVQTFSYPVDLTYQAVGKGEK